MYLPGAPRPTPLQPPPSSESFPTPTKRTLSSPPWIHHTVLGTWGGDWRVWPRGTHPVLLSPDRRLVSQMWHICKLLEMCDL